MSGFDWFTMVDWSAANDTGPTPRKDAIWIGAVLGDVEQKPVYCRNRQRALDDLSMLIQHALHNRKRLLIGFDFPFGYPAGFARRITGSTDALGVWEFYRKHLDDRSHRNNRFELAGRLNRLFPGVGPFWFNGLKTDIPDLPRKGTARTSHGMTERREAERNAKGTFSCWQMGGAGAVGGQVMTGMAALAALRRWFPDEVAVWPFEPLDRPVAFVEIWPGLIADAVKADGDPIRDRAQVRLLARAMSRLPREDLEAMLSVDAPEEGWILGLGHEAQLRSQLCPA